MARRVSLTSTPSASHQKGARASSPEGEEAVRTYLRVLVGAPIRATDRVEKAEAAFVEAVVGWADETGVDSKTLSAVGVSRRVLDEAGMRPTPVSELVRRQYTDAFTVADLVRRSGVSSASVRAVLAEDERAGQLKRVASTGRTVLYGLR